MWMHALSRTLMPAWLGFVFQRTLISRICMYGDPVIAIAIVSLAWPDRFFSVFLCAVTKKNGKKRSGHARKS